MKNAGIDKFIIALIGIPGLTACVLAWVQPMDISERIQLTAIGGAGLIWALIRSLFSRLMPAKASARTGETELEKSPVH